MPRYIVERTFAEGLRLPADGDGMRDWIGIVEQNADDGVTWLHSYVSSDETKSFCVYEAPTPEAIRRAAARNALPLDRITRVSVLDPHYFS